MKIRAFLKYAAPLLCMIVLVTLLLVPASADELLGAPSVTLLSDGYTFRISHSASSIAAYRILVNGSVLASVSRTSSSTVYALTNLAGASGITLGTTYSLSVYGVDSSGTVVTATSLTVSWEAIAAAPTTAISGTSLRIQHSSSQIASYQILVDGSLRSTIARSAYNTIFDLTTLGLTTGSSYTISVYGLNSSGARVTFGSVDRTWTAVLAAPSLSINGDILTIVHSSEEIYQYSICIDGELVATVTRSGQATQVDLTTLDLSDYEEDLELTDGSTHSITVYGCSSTSQLTVVSSSVSWTLSSSSSPLLDAPMLELSGDTLTILHTSSYISQYAICINDEQVIITRDSAATQVDLSQLFEDFEFDDGFYWVTVFGCSGSKTRLTETSSAVTWTKSSLLAAPTISLNGDILTIVHSSEDVPSYAIYVDGDLKTTISRSGQATEYDLTQLDLSDGTYSITVVGCTGQTRLTEESAASSYTVGSSGTTTVKTIKAGQWACRTSSVVSQAVGTPAEWPFTTTSKFYLHDAFESCGSKYTGFSCSYDTLTASYTLCYDSTPVYRYASTTNPELTGVWYDENFSKIYLSTDCVTTSDFYAWFTATYTYLGSDRVEDVVKTTVKIFDNTGETLLKTYVFTGTVAPEVTLDITDDGCTLTDENGVSYTFTYDGKFYGLNRSAGKTSVDCQPGQQLVLSPNGSVSYTFVFFLGDCYSFTANVYSDDGTLLKSFVHESFEAFDIKVICTSTGIEIYSPYADGKLRTIVNAGYSVSGVSDVADLSHIFLTSSEFWTFSNICSHQVYNLYLVRSSGSSSGSGGSIDASTFSGFGNFVTSILGGFFAVEFIPGISLSGIFSFVFGLLIVCILLKVFS